MRLLPLLALFSVCALFTGSAAAQTIDSLPEGTTGTTLALTHVTLTDLDQGLGTAPDAFFVDDASTALLQYDVGSFANNKVVSFGGYTPGGDNLYGRCKSFRILISQATTAIYFNMWVSRAEAGNSVQFEFKLAGQSQFTASILIPPGTAPFHMRLPWHFQSFDEIVVSGIGPHLGGAFHGVIDGFLFAIVDFAPTCDGNAFGSHVPCPCGNESNAYDSEGCMHSLGYGARLRFSGNTSIANDTFQLVCMQLPPNSPALFFQGTQYTNSGSGSPFGDGLRCAGGTVVRLGTKTADQSGTAVYPGPGDAPISVRGQVTAPGIRTYQVWHRNAAAFCTSSTFNLSNGFAFSWSL